MLLEATGVCIVARGVGSLVVSVGVNSRGSGGTERTEEGTSRGSGGTGPLDGRKSGFSSELFGCVSGVARCSMLIPAKSAVRCFSGEF